MRTEVSRLVRRLPLSTPLFTVVAEALLAHAAALGGEGDAGEVPEGLRRLRRGEGERGG